MARTRGAGKIAKALLDPSLPPSRVIPSPWSAEVAARRIEPPPFPWGEYFDGSQPVEIDIGCGKGRFILARARKNRGVRYLGVERELSRVSWIDYIARTEGLGNVNVLRADALPLVARMLPDSVASKVYFFFPDPWPKRKQRNRRLFKEEFLSGVRRVLREGGELHVATDQQDYMGDMDALLAADASFEQIETLAREPEEQTDFERIFISKGLPTYGSSWRLVSKPAPAAAGKEA